MVKTDNPGEPVPEENFWTLWCKGRLTEADTLTIRLGATPSGLTSAHVHHLPHIFLWAGCPSCCNHKHFYMLPCWIFIFQNFQFLMVGRVERVNMRHVAKFRGDQSNRCSHMAIFPRWWLSAILHSKNLVILLANRMQMIKAHQHVKFRQNRAIYCRDIAIF